MIQNSGDGEFRYEDSKIWRQGDSSWLSWTFDGSNLARCSSENPTLSRVNQRGFVLLDDSETDMILTSQIEPLNVFLPMHWQLAASIFLQSKSLFCKRTFQVPNQERNISTTQTSCCIHHISPYTIVVSRNLISHWNLPSTISGLFTCRYHGLKVPPFELASQKKTRWVVAAPTIFLHSIKVSFSIVDLYVWRRRKIKGCQRFFVRFFPLCLGGGFNSRMFLKKITVPEEIRTNMSQDSTRHHFFRGTVPRWNVSRHQVITPQNFHSC